ncbi:hypothetical protein Hanom_Chr11g01021071 [Helianthus anomalus]
MVRTKEKAGASSSSQPQGEEQPKRRRLTRVGDPDSEEDAPPRGPNCNKGKKLQQEIRELDFGPFGITDKFKALGWEAALKCYDNEIKTMYDEHIQEWMAMLECPPFKAPNRMKLIGTCSGVKVEMSYDSLRRITKFDSKSSNQYIYPSLKDLYHEPKKHPQRGHMLDYLFVPGTTHGKLFRRNLRIEAKLMLILCTHNVIP